MPDKPVRIGYVPEHYLIPLHLAKAHFTDHKSVELVPFPSGTGHMITSLRSDEIDVGIGLTEGWVAGLLSEQGQKEKGYSIIGSWVRNPLRWAIVTGRNRDDIKTVDDLQEHNRVGVSRMGSGSHIMSFVLADQKGWLKQSKEDESEILKIKPLGPFKDLRNGVTGGDGKDPTADFFMWEHFTTKPFFDGDGTPLKHIGEIYTPWPSWHIAASTKTFPDPGKDQTVSELFENFDKGVKEFNKDPQAAIQRLVAGEFGCEYSEEDAVDWMISASFFDKTKGVDPETMQNVVKVLQKAGVINSSTEITADSGVIGIKRS